MADMPSAVWPPIVVEDGSPASRLPGGFASTPRPPAEGFYLCYVDGALTLRHAGAPKQDRGLRIDYDARTMARRLVGAARSPLAKAVGLRRHAGSQVLDVTCGLGRDSAILAALGCTVVSLERHPVMYALVDDARARALAQRESLLGTWQACHHADAIEWLGTHHDAMFDVVYIDPMFDAPRRKARPQKALAWMHELIGADTDIEALLEHARAHALRQVVIKQHARSQPLGSPHRQIEGKAIRFDVYVTAKPA